MPSIEDDRTGPIRPAEQDPIVLLAGPTGVGKTALAIELAEALGAEIVSADSRQVYRGMAIGTAQPTEDELRRVPHHLVGFLSPNQPFSVAQLVDAAETALREISGRGRLPLVVGGTYHYVQALLGELVLPRVPPNDLLRRELEALSHERGAKHLHDRLEQLDPAAAAAIPMENVRRIVRALEVIDATGRRFSDVGRVRGLPRSALRLALSMPRTELYELIDKRVDTMIARGWLDEIRAMLDAGYDRSLPALSSTGYRDLIRYLDGQIALDEAVRRVKYSTHAYVRRQYAWLRRDTSLVWLEQGRGAFDQALRLIRAYLSSNEPAETSRASRPDGGRF